MINSINIINKLEVLKSIVLGQRKNCPFCASMETTRFGKNAILSHVRLCKNCHLMYRWPKQHLEFNNFFYQVEYSRQQQGAVTTLPSEQELPQLINNSFDSIGKNFDLYISIMNKIGIKSLVDFGASWGYGVFQFQAAGINAVGMEISKIRAGFGRNNLGVSIFSNETDLINLPHKFDAVFTSHVLEHLPTPQTALEFFKKIIKPQGWMIASVPNCGGEAARKRGLAWGPFSSSLHPLSYSSDFFKFALPKYGFDKPYFYSSPFDAECIVNSLLNNVRDDHVGGDNLLVIAKYIGQ